MAKKQPKGKVRGVQNKIKKNCVVCDEEFLVWNYAKDWKKFCSNKCKHSDIGKKIISKQTQLGIQKTQRWKDSQEKHKLEIKNCLKCQREFLGKKTDICCSKSCRVSWSKRSTKVWTICKICGKRTSNTKYCSNKCQHIDPDYINAVSKANKGHNYITEEQRKKISQVHKGKKLTAETLRKRSETIANRTPEEQSIVNLNHRKAFIKNKIQKLEKGAQLFPNYNPKSIPILEQKAKELGITDLQHAENGGEFYIEELGYWVDGYSKEHNIVFEYDEKHHFNEDGTYTDRDVRRQKEIENLLGCKFIRIAD